MNFTHIVIFTISLFLLAAHVAAQEEVKRYDANAKPQVLFEIKNSKKPIFPASLKNLGYNDGTATFAIYVDQFGQLADYLLLEATHMAFANAVERVLPDWQYSVPYVDGESSAFLSTIKVTFERGGGVVYQTTGIDVLPFFGSHRNEEMAYRVHGIWELDSIPEPINIVKPEFHTELLEERDLVTAVFEFYIDTDGNVRMPTLRNADDRVDERLLVIAQESLLRWKFNAPTVRGEPVLTRAAQPLRFRRGDNGGVVE